MSDNSSPLHQRRAASSGSAAASAAAARRAEKEGSGSGSTGSGSTGSGSTGSGTRASSSRLSDGSFRYVDNYGLLVCLGEGGMGEVWAARDPKAPKNRVVALKLTKQQGAEAAKVLWDEARIASLIDHPNVCRVHELGMADGQQYLVMDYCDGASLHDLLERLPGRMLAPPMAARIVANVSEGLHAAHELCDEQGHHMGVVHRDVSPQNLLISTAGGITVADFGVARAAGQAHKATETGEMKGKLSYMAPEQVTSKDIDRRVDVFALGCVLYQVTLGKRPFHGEDALATLYQLLEKDLVRPSALDPSYPAELEQIVLKALAKDRSERFATAHELALALERFLVHSGQQVTDGDVARLLLERLGTEITARKEEIRRRAAALDKGPKIATAGGERVETEAGTVSETPPSARSTWVVRLMAGAVFLAVAGGSVFLLREPKVAAVPPPTNGAVVDPTAPAADPGASATAPAEQTVRLSVSATPKTARIELDGQEVGVGTYQGTHLLSGAQHRLVVSAPGYESQSRELGFLEAQSLEVSLKALASGMRPSNTGSTKKPVTDPSASNASKPGTTGQPSNGKKPPRSLDATNPFATP